LFFQAAPYIRGAKNKESFWLEPSNFENKSHLHGAIMEYAFAALLGVLLIMVFGYAWLEAKPGALSSDAVAGAVPEEPGGDSFQSFLSTRYFSGLDACRALSVLGVIWTHVSGVHDINLLNQGNKGVDLFFAISGFLVSTLLLREYARNGRIALGDFYIRRTLRIFPLYYAVLAVYCVLVFLTLRGTPRAMEFWNNLPAFTSYTSNWFVNLNNGADHGVTFYLAWSLATEEQFYLFWPSLMVFLLWKLNTDWILAPAAMALIGLQALAAYVDGGLLATVIASMAPAILLGAAFAVLLNKRSTFNFLYPILGSKLMAPAAGLWVLAMMQLDAPLVLTRFMMAVLVATVCVREDTYLHPLLKWRPAAFVGTISYGIYLMHMLVANFVRNVLGHASGIDVFMATTVLVIVIAYLSFHFFETPVLRMKNRFGAHRRGAKNAELPVPVST
jgi:peptidoglycan/LPS O-acetylase OafA/YrhL